MLYPHAEKSAMAVKMLRLSRGLATTIRIRSDERDNFWSEVVFRLGLGCGLRGSNGRDSAPSLRCD